jgi:hypothetical protein
MAKLDLFNPEQLQKQIRLQRQNAWSEEDIPFSLSINPDLDFLPLDEDNLFFPQATLSQKVALSQLFGLIVNEIISEMECCLPRLKYVGWEMMLKKYPISPELEELGEIFFEEEEKHAKVFRRYLHLFAEKMGLDLVALKSLLPKAFNSNFQNTIIENAKNGGHAFWWVVASVEDVSVQVFKEIRKHRAAIDPLFYELHRFHAEEEARHENYAFLMLEVAKNNSHSLSEKLHVKKDLLIAQAIAGPWLLTELTKVFRAQEYRHQHPWFEAIASSLPLFGNLSKAEVVQKCWSKAPYIGWLINPSYQKKNLKHAKSHGALSWV